MTNTQPPTGKPTGEPVEENRPEQTERAKQGTDNPVVKEALKKENQPARAGDLSHLHDTHEIGTSGGDQRAKDTESPADEGNGHADARGK